MHKSKVIHDLSEFISIQSVSADSSRFPEIKKAVQFLQQKLEKLGCEVIVTQSTNKPPIIIGIKKVKGASKTIGIYGHYDVQSEDPVSEWKSKPYVLTQKNGHLYGRGVADNKGHVIQNLAAIEDLISTGKLTNNIIFLFEGEEEIGSEQFAGIIKKYKKILSTADVFFITDVGMYAKNVPQIIYSLRGLAYFEIQVAVGKSDLHSGVYGNSVYNPIQILSELFVRMKDVDTGEVHIPQFYDNVRKIDKKEKNLLAKATIPDRNFQDEMNSFTTTTMRKVPSYLAPKIFPSMDIHGIVGGYIGEGPKTVIPKTATAKFSFRLVEYQTPDEIEKKVTTFVKRNIPKGVQFNLQTLSLDDSFYTSIKDPFIQNTAAILAEHFNHETILMREGGSIPAAAIIQNVLKKPVVLTGFILPDSNLHAPNENMNEDMFWEGIEALKKIYLQD